MKKTKLTLLTLDYPPNVGGVARYLGDLVRVSEGGIRVEDARPFKRTAWPTWWPMVKRIRETADIVFVSHVFPVGTAAWIARMLGGPEYIVLFHGLDVRLARGFWKKWLLQRICDKAKALFAVSEATKNEVLKRTPGVEITILPPGVDAGEEISRHEARERLGIDQDVRLVLSVCRLVPRKGIDIALKAMSRIQREHETDYVVLGDGPDRERLEGVAQQSRTRVRWVRDPEDGDVRLWMAAADVFVLPVRDEGYDVEGFGIVYLEAAMVGLASVAGKSGGAPEAVRHERTGLVVEPMDVGAVADAIRKLLQDEELRLKLGVQARERVLKDFRWEDRWVKLKARLGI